MAFIYGVASLEFNRISNPLKSSSFFLFGARGTGKTSLLRALLPVEKTLVIDLLKPNEEERYARNPEFLIADVEGQGSKIQWVMIDEIQKLPKLLDVVHHLIESEKIKSRGVKFALTGSSARKLKHGGANLLAGRAFMNELFPLTFAELGEAFDLDAVLNWGSLPRVFSLPDAQSKDEFLRSYAQTYLKEEIWAEHLVEKLDPFRKFLEIAAQTSGHIVNFENIAKDTGVDGKTVKRYFSILEDTLVGFFLESFSRSVRKRQLKKPKFYLFDLGVKRALEHTLTQQVIPRTFAYGRAFEHLVIAECLRFNSYRRLDFRFSYVRTKDDAEIDLIIERPGKSIVLVEIKSSENTDERDISHLKSFLKDFAGAEAFCWSLNPRPMQIDGVQFRHWQDGMKEIGLG